MAHHHRRRMVEPLDQQARFVPDRDATAAPATAVMPWPRSQSSAVTSNAWATSLVLGLEQAPIAGAGPHALFDAAGRARARRYAPRCARRVRPSRAASEQLRLAMFEQRILARGEQRDSLALQRRHPVRVAAIEAIRRDRRIRACSALGLDRWIVTALCCAPWLVSWADHFAISVARPLGHCDGAGDGAHSAMLAATKVMD